ncbi:MAG: N-6 DNA methylase [Desulfomonilaceae bacterium]
MSNALKTLHEAIATDVARFSEYTREVQSFLCRLSGLEIQEVNDQISSQILNGETSSALQRLVPVEIRKRAGLFFTNNTLAKKIADILRPELQGGAKLLDPACGAGNLLIACARHLPTGHNLDQTLTLWSKLIRGYDFHIEFIRTAQLRLLLLALSLHLDETTSACNLKPDQIFTGLRVKDTFAQSSLDQDACIVINPPFGTCWTVR